VIEAPEQPEAMGILRQLRRFNITWVKGGYEDQPYILMRELNEVVETELEHERIEMLNEIFKANAASGENKLGIQ
jgi:hypothetical protein